MGHHGGNGTMAAAMVHRVLSIYVSFVRELYVKYTFPPNKIEKVFANTLSRRLHVRFIISLLITHQFCVNTIYTVEQHVKEECCTSG